MNLRTHSCVQKKYVLTYAPKYLPHAAATVYVLTHTQFVEVLPEVIGGSADLTPSTLTKVKGNEVDYNHSHPEGTYVQHVM